MFTVCLFAAAALLIQSASAVPADRGRRSDRDLEQFASALNGALRLRYGKRSYDPNLFDKIFTLQFVLSIHSATV
ncbi:unnamed protein product [Gongylonema pulchrum]|uniref:Secreted protein n=1 Tax=Gongylonema pulchrum TaxID=637853 RepID=A0A183D5A4_9BILA|nr:unnamed protein product [Gongylonema pulchrum]